MGVGLPCDSRTPRLPVKLNMVCLVVWTFLSMQVLNPAGSDSTRVPVAAGGERIPGTQQDTSHVSSRQLPVVIAPAIGHGRSLETLLAGQDSSTDVVAVFESLMMQYPQLRSLLLHEFLIPSGSDAFQKEVSAKDQFSSQIQQMAKLSRFQQMSLAAKRFREIFEHSPRYDMMVPEINVKTTIAFFLTELYNLLK